MSAKRGFSQFLIIFARTSERTLEFCRDGQESCHNAKVLTNTDIWGNGLRVCGNCHFLRNDPYPLRSWLLTPYGDTGRLTPQQRNYKIRHSGTNVTIARAFGCLKGHFRRLRYLETSELKTSVEVIILCRIIHNDITCILNNEDVQEYFEDMTTSQDLMCPTGI